MMRIATMPSEVAYQSTPESTSASAAAQAELPLDEMTRILDVAAQLHAREAVIEEQLHLDAIKDDLRKRLLAAAKVAGEPLTAEQVDHAIDFLLSKGSPGSRCSEGTGKEPG